jgi:hypothetical protein
MASGVPISGISKPDLDNSDAAISLLGIRRSKIRKTRGSSVSRYGFKSARSEFIGPSPNFESGTGRYGAGTLGGDLQPLENHGPRRITHYV